MLSKKTTSLICISTPGGSDNIYSQLLEMQDPSTGKSMFKVGACRVIIRRIRDGRTVHGNRMVVKKKTLIFIAVYSNNAILTFNRIFAVCAHRRQLQDVRRRWTCAHVRTHAGRYPSVEVYFKAKATGGDHGKRPPPAPSRKQGHYRRRLHPRVPKAIHRERHEERRDALDVARRHFRVGRPVRGRVERSRVRGNVPDPAGDNGEYRVPLDVGGWGTTGRSTTTCSCGGG